jgi:hypothetical protein
MGHTGLSASPMHTLTRFSVSIEATRPVKWPHFAGSTLRGAFGRALRRAACITGRSQCTDCPVRAQCAYGAVFDPSAPTQPLHPSFNDGIPRYLVQAPSLGACHLEAGQAQHFDLLLLPGTHTHHQFVAHTLKAATETELLQPGLFRLARLAVDTVPLTLPSPQRVPPDAVAQADIAQTTLRWLTPLRLQAQGKPLFHPQQLDSAILLRALLGRYLQCCQLTGQQPLDSTLARTAASACILDTRKLHWYDMLRHSSTQDKKLPLGGLMGSATWRGPRQALEVLLPLLHLGAQVHIGKEIVMGMGQYQVGALQTG